MYYQRSSAFIGGLQSDRHRSPTTVWPQMNADKRRFARDLLRLSSYFLDTTLASQRNRIDSALMGRRNCTGTPGGVRSCRLPNCKLSQPYQVRWRHASIAVRFVKPFLLVT